VGNGAGRSQRNRDDVGRSIERRCGSQSTRPRYPDLHSPLWLPDARAVISRGSDAFEVVWPLEPIRLRLSRGRSAPNPPERRGVARRGVAGNRLERVKERRGRRASKDNAGGAPASRAPLGSETRARRRRWSAGTVAADGLAALGGRALDSRRCRRRLGSLLRGNGASSGTMASTASHRPRSTRGTGSSAGFDPGPAASNGHPGPGRSCNGRLSIC